MERQIPKRPVIGFTIAVVIAAIFFALSFISFPETTALDSTAEWAHHAADGDVIARIMWVFADFVQPTFHANAIAGILMLVGCILALYIPSLSKNSFGVSYGTGLFWPILLAQLISSAGSVWLYQSIWDLEVGPGGGLFLPSFIGIASFVPAIVIKYGTQWYKLVTAGVMGILFGTPFAYFIHTMFQAPWGLPGANAWVTPMIVIGFVSYQICDNLPWMNDGKVNVPENPKGVPNATEMNDVWFVKRVFADFTEPTYFGNELAGLLCIVGSVIACFLNPNNPFYGVGASELMTVISCQILASAIGILLYWHKYAELGFYNTFVPIASMAPAFLLFYGFEWYDVVVSAVVTAVIMPPVAAVIGAKAAKAGYHGYIGSVASMFINCIIITAIFNYMPGFGG